MLNLTQHVVWRLYSSRRLANVEIMEGNTKHLQNWWTCGPDCMADELSGILEYGPRMHAKTFRKRESIDKQRGKYT